MIKSWIHLLTIHLSYKAITPNSYHLWNPLRSPCAWSVGAWLHTWICENSFPAVVLRLSGCSTMTRVACCVCLCMPQLERETHTTGTLRREVQMPLDDICLLLLPIVISSIHSQYTFAFPTPWVFGRSLNFFNSICRSKTSRRLATSASLPYIPSLTSELSASLSCWRVRSST